MIPSIAKKVRQKSSQCGFSISHLLASVQMNRKTFYHYLVNEGAGMSDSNFRKLKTMETFLEQVTSFRETYLGGQK